MRVFCRDPDEPLVPPPGYRHADESLNAAAGSAAAPKEEELAGLKLLAKMQDLMFQQREERRKKEEKALERQRQFKAVLRGQPSVAFLEIGQREERELADAYANIPHPSLAATTSAGSTPAHDHDHYLAYPPPRFDPSRDARFVHVESRANAGFALGVVPLTEQSTVKPVGLLWSTSYEHLSGDARRPRFEPTPPLLLPQANAAVKHALRCLKTSIQNNEAGPPPLSQTMESAGLQQTPLLHRHHSPDLHVMPSDLGTPAHVTDHGVPSNLRSTEDNFCDQPLPPELDTADLPLDARALFATTSNEQEPTTPVPNSIEQDATSLALDSVLGAQPGPLTREQQSESGYAMLSFADSYHVLKHPNLVIVRDEHYQRRAQAEKKMEKREAKRREIQERHTQRALNDYAQEPSQPSQTGDYPSSASADGENLEGRPARGLLSHYSEQGGPVAYYPPSDDDAERFRRRERRRIKPSSSSATSINPGDLHHFDTITMSARDGEAYTGSAATDDGENWAQLPVHTANPDDIKQISREHLIFSYDPENLRWVLHVVGNNAYVGDQLYRKGQRNIPLESGTEIFISTLRIVFRLPIQVDNPESVDSDEDVDELEEEVVDVDSSPEQRLSKSSEVDAEDEDAEEPERVAQKKPIKLKLKAPKAPTKAPAKAPASGKGKGKGKGKEPATKESGKSKKVVESKASVEPESAKPAEKGKSKKPAETTAVAGENSAEPTTAEQTEPARPAAILPGSILEGLAPNEMPEKRKGPGRPPKNGFLSKRDERAVLRRQKEYERRGLLVPEFNSILAEVREEQKSKDALAKGNKLRAEGATDAVESIEAADQPQDGAAGPSQARDSHTSQSADPAGGQAGSSGLARRPLRSPSPMKPAEEFTEEELKKPAASYFYLLDEILQAVGQADLQTIYDKFQKRWPYYRYSVTTNGWQSSIRHNLSQFSRFKAVGKVGKGQLWAIDYNAPREENTKKKKTPPPPRNPPPMQNGSMQNGGQPPVYQHGQPQYQPQYNQGVYNPGQGQYSSPYGTQGGQYPPQGHPGPAGYNQIRPMGNGNPGNRPAHMMPPPAPVPQPAPPANPIQAITADIMRFRLTHMAAFPTEGPLFDAENKKFFQGVDYFSAIFHGQTKEEAGYPGEETLRTEPWLTLQAIFDRHDKRGSTGANAQSGESNGTTNGQNQDQGQQASQNGMPNGQNNGQNMPPQQPQPSQQQMPQPMQQPNGQQPNVQQPNVQQPYGQQPNGYQGASSMGPPSHAMPTVGQGVQNIVASQTAAAAAQTSQMPPANAAQSNAQPTVQQPGHPGGSNAQQGMQQAVYPNAAPAPAPAQPQLQMPNVQPGTQNEQQATAAPASAPSQPDVPMPDVQYGVQNGQQTTVAPPPAPTQPAMQHPNGQLGIMNEEQPAATTPVLAEVRPQQTPKAPSPSPLPDQQTQPSPSVEPPRPVSAGVKRGAEDANMEDADAEVKRLRTE